MPSYFGAVRRRYQILCDRATARDVILQACANTSAKRKTRDLDIAIAVNGWDKYDEIKHILTSNGFEKDDYYA